MRERIAARHDKHGRELLDPRPMEPPLGYKRAPSLSEQIRQQVLAHKLEELQAIDETDEEADDFAIDDDLGPYSQHENEGMPTIKELKARVEEINNEIRRQNLENLIKVNQERHDNLAARNNRGATAPPSEAPSSEHPPGSRQGP